MPAPFCDCLRAAELNVQITVTHFSQISPWNKECKDAPLSLSWHCVLFIHPILHSQPSVKSIFIPLCSYSISWVYNPTFPTAPKTWHIEKKKLPTKHSVLVRNEIELHHQMSGWACKTSASHSSKNWKAGQSRWSSSKWVTATAYSIHQCSSAAISIIHHQLTQETQGDTAYQLVWFCILGHTNPSFKSQTKTNS